MKLDRLAPCINTNSYVSDSDTDTDSNSDSNSDSDAPTTAVAY